MAEDDAWLFESFLLSHYELREVARTVVGDVTVSTVHLGIPHPGIDGPLNYETMIFGGPLDEHQWRYETYEQAVAGHEQALAQVQALRADR